MTARTLNRLRQIQVEQARPCACAKALLRPAIQRSTESLAHKATIIIEHKSVLRDNISDQCADKWTAPIAHAAVQRRSRRNDVIIQVKNVQVQFARTIRAVSYTHLTLPTN